MHTVALVEFKDGTKLELILPWLEFLKLWRTAEIEGKVVTKVTCEGKTITFE